MQIRRFLQLAWFIMWTAGSNKERADTPHWCWSDCRSLQVILCSHRSAQDLTANEMELTIEGESSRLLELLPCPWDSITRPSFAVQTKQGCWTVRPEKKLARELSVTKSIEVTRRSGGGVGKQSSACELCSRPAYVNVSKAHSNQLRFTRYSYHTASVDYGGFTVSHHMSTQDWAS